MSGRLQALGFTLPAYIGAMPIASVIRNVDDATRIIGLSQRTIDDIGNVALSDRFGPAPRAFLVVPMVGAFFIDFVNAVLITFCLNIWG